MIVQCDKCRTKFRIADEKVAASGVKVRCSRCAHVFMVQRDPTLVPPASSSDVDRALNNVGLGISNDGNIPTVATAIPTALMQHHAQQHGPGGALPSFPESGKSRPLTPINPFESPRPSVPHAPTDVYPVPSLVPAAATTKDAMIALGFAAPPQPEDSPRRTFDEESTAQFTAASLLPPDRRGMSFEDLDSQSQRFPAPAPINSFDELFGKEPPTAVGVRPPMFDDQMPSNPSMPSLESLRALEQHESFGSPRAGSEVNTLRSSPGLTAPASNPAMHAQTPPPPPPAPKSSPALNALAAAEVGTPSDPLTSPFFPPPTGIPGLNTTTNLQAILALQNGDKNGSGLSSSDLGDIPGLMPPTSSEDPFAGLDLEGPAYGGGDLGGEDPLAETRAITPETGQTPSKALAKIDLGRAGVPSPFESNLATTRVATALLPDHTDQTVDLLSSIEGNRRWPTYVGLGIGLLITAAAMVGPAGGNLSQLGPEDIVALFSTPLSEPIDTSVGSIEPKNAQVTLYPGKGGKMLLVVAGEAYNDGDQAIAGLEAVASVRNGKEVLEQREGWVGLTLDEAALSTIGSPAELEVAIADALRSAQLPIDKKSLAPGESAPFMVIFPDPPADLERRAFRVDFRRGSMSATRAQ
jgi:predicted Zn finger-like uncharacterized protein